MDDNARKLLRNAIALAVADGRVHEDERGRIDRLRKELGVEDDEFRRLCQQVREDPDSVEVPTDPGEAQAMMEALVELAAADGTVGDAERGLLHRVAYAAGIESARVNMVLAGTADSPASHVRTQSLADEIYRRFREWDDPTRRAALARLAAESGDGVIALLRIFESYRRPEGMGDALELKALVAEQLGELGDDRAVYYLAQQVSIGDEEDDFTNAALRHAAAGAVGRILAIPEFTPDPKGVVAIRRWIGTPKALVYDRIAY